MSACAGSLIKVFRVFRNAGFQVRLLCRYGTVRAAGEVFSSISPARSGWIAPGRIGFMSTQRRENRPTPATEYFRGWRWSISNPVAVAGRRQIRNASRPSGRQERNGHIQIPVAHLSHAYASGTAAQPVDLALFHSNRTTSLGTPAAASLPSDCSNTLFVGLVPKGTCRSRSPFRAGRCDTRPLHISPKQTPLPVLRVSIRICRGYRQP